MDTDPLSETTFDGIDTTMHVFSGSKNYLIGLMVELNLAFGLAVEADALYRPLNLTRETRGLRKDHLPIPSDRMP